MDEHTHVIHSFQPVFDSNSRILILGSLPSVKSRETGFYYGHPQNRFWRLVALLTKNEVPNDITQKTELLKKCGIALYDVIAECDIIGSSDSSIKNAVPADLSPIFSAADIRRIYANGAASARLYRKFQQKLTGREITVLPSTSPANAAWNMDRLAQTWKIILDDLL